MKSSASISMAVVGISVFLSACSNLYEPTPQITKAEDRTIVSNTASLSHVIIYNQKNYGVGTSRNIGISAARGKYLIFLYMKKCL